MKIFLFRNRKKIIDGFSFLTPFMLVLWIGVQLFKFEAPLAIAQNTQPIPKPSYSTYLNLVNDIRSEKANLTNPLAKAYFESISNAFEKDLKQTLDSTITAPPAPSGWNKSVIFDLVKASCPGAPGDYTPACCFGLIKGTAYGGCPTNITRENLADQIRAALLGEMSVLTRAKSIQAALGDLNLTVTPTTSNSSLPVPHPSASSSSGPRFPGVLSAPLDLKLPGGIAAPGTTSTEKMRNVVAENFERMVRVFVAGDQQLGIDKGITTTTGIDPDTGALVHVNANSRANVSSTRPSIQGMFQGFTPDILNSTDTDIAQGIFYPQWAASCGISLEDNSVYRYFKVNGQYPSAYPACTTTPLPLAKTRGAMVSALLTLMLKMKKDLIEKGLIAPASAYNGVTDPCTAMKTEIRAMRATIQSEFTQFTRSMGGSFTPCNLSQADDAEVLPAQQGSCLLTVMQNLVEQGYVSQYMYCTWRAVAESVIQKFQLADQGGPAEPPLHVEGADPSGAMRARLLRGLRGGYAATGVGIVKCETLEGLFLGTQQYPWVPLYIHDRGAFHGSTLAPLSGYLTGKPAGPSYCDKMCYSVKESTETLTAIAANSPNASPSPAYSTIYKNALDACQAKTYVTHFFAWQKDFPTNCGCPAQLPLLPIQGVSTILMPFQNNLQTLQTLYSGGSAVTSSPPTCAGATGTGPAPTPTCGPNGIPICGNGAPSKGTPSCASGGITCSVGTPSIAFCSNSVPACSSGKAACTDGILSCGTSTADTTVAAAPSPSPSCPEGTVATCTDSATAAKPICSQHQPTCAAGKTLSCTSAGTATCDAAAVKAADSPSCPIGTAACVSGVATCRPPVPACTSGTLTCSQDGGAYCASGSGANPTLSTPACGTTGYASCTYGQPRRAVCRPLPPTPAGATTPFAAPSCSVSTGTIAPTCTSFPQCSTGGGSPRCDQGEAPGCYDGKPACYPLPTPSSDIPEGGGSTGDTTGGETGGGDWGI